MRPNRSAAAPSIVHGIGQFNGLTNQTSITLANGSTTEITFDNNGLKGSVDFTLEGGLRCGSRRQ